MSMRHTVKVRAGAAVVAVSGLAFALAGCGGGDDGKPASAQSVSAPQPTAGQSQNAASDKSGSAAATIIATAAGEEGMVLEINEARRDQGGFLTVSGNLKNTGAKDFNHTTAWRGNELTGSGESVAGATLVDKAGKKRYYVLRDTEGRCLCTTGVNSIGAGKALPIFAQFPAPPTTTTEVEFNLPTFASATIKISG
ncbi:MULTISPECIES: hypothetical protein [Streptomyces]|uniref:hypothetical protein n=1 Tax=Streptomyces TaxID=1883 RepID=UPI001674BDD8|nr:MULTISPECIES: hypothetical protein [Streptomyces]MBD3576499.1 hypothetical protein [Streptomyces sp. KD18]GGS88806.1 hypothetical protein GCM10010286_11920 [Streptomyces toxytricini]